MKKIANCIIRIISVIYIILLTGIFFYMLITNKIIYEGFFLFRLFFDLLAPIVVLILIGNKAVKFIDFMYNKGPFLWSVIAIYFLILAGSTYLFYCENSIGNHSLSSGMSTIGVTGICSVLYICNYIKDKQAEKL